MIDVIDYGIGNIGSIQNMIKHIGGKSKVITTPEEIMSSKKLILPGVGSFDSAMNKLIALNLKEAIKLAAKNGTYIYGICLGMQILFENSEEGIQQGLGLLEGNVIKFKDDSVRIPHVGWNKVFSKKESVLFHDLTEQQKFYFTHSYYVKCSNLEDISATTFYGDEFTCAVARNNIIGTQFHPEKSHKYGMKLFSNYCNL